MFPFRKKETNEERCFVLGDDRRLFGKALVSTGAFLLDDNNKFAYDNTVHNMAPHIVCRANGVVQKKGQCALLYENSAQPWNWEKQEWNQRVINEKTLLQDGRMEAIGSISQEQEEDEKWQKFMPILYAALAILALVALIACISGGVFDKAGEVF